MNQSHSRILQNLLFLLNLVIYVARSFCRDSGRLARRIFVTDSQSNLIIIHNTSALTRAEEHVSRSCVENQKSFRKYFGRYQWRFSPPILYHRRHNLFRPTNANVLGTANPLALSLSSELDAEKISKKNFSRCKREFQRI